jgi:F-type H+-transporting ATPase subunit a
MTNTLLMFLATAQETAHEAAEGAHQAVAEHGAEAAHGAAGAVEHGGGHDPGTILMHHVLDSPFYGLSLSKHMVFLFVVAAIVLLITRVAVSSYKKGRPSGIGSVVETFVVFIRDEIAEPNIGHDGAKFVPLLCSFFFFILTSALLGLVPIPNRDGSGAWSIGGITSTGNLAVTAGLALVSLIAQQYAGISKFGFVHHVKNLVPPGIPGFLLPIIILVEVFSVFTKPFALLVRLFANMLAGHLVITALLLLIPILAQVSLAFGVAVIPLSVGLALFISVLELLVAFIQAYIFTLLSAIFIGMYAHPAH